MFHSDSKANIEAIETTEGTVGVFHHQTPPLDSGKAIQAGAEVQTQCLKGRQGLEVLAGDRLAHDLLKATLLQYRSAMSNAQISLSKALAVLSKLHSRAHQTAEARMASTAQLLMAEAEGRSIGLRRSCRRGSKPCSCFGVSCG